MTTRYFDNAQIGIHVSVDIVVRFAKTTTSTFGGTPRIIFYYALLMMHLSNVSDDVWVVRDLGMSVIFSIYVLHSCTTTTCEDDFMLTDAS